MNFAVLPLAQAMAQGLSEEWGCQGEAELLETK